MQNPGSRFEVVSQADIPEMRHFLARVFQTDLRAPFINERLMHWKCFEPRPDWPSGRGFMLRRNDKTVAVATLVPITLLPKHGPVPAVLPIDWAADGSLPGSGVILHRKLAQTAKVIIQIGGSEQARKVAPLLSLKPLAPLLAFAKVTRPFLQFRMRPAHDWKSVLRIGRNLYWSLSGRAQEAGNWSAVPVRVFKNSMLPKINCETMTPCVRDADLLNYFMRCPTVEMAGFHLFRSGQLQGYFILSRVGAQARIADLRVASSNPEDWRSAYALATRAAGQNPRVCEVEAVASIKIVADAILANGFRPRGSEPVWIGDPEGLLEGAAPIHISMFESDRAYLYNPSDPFLS